MVGNKLDKWELHRIIDSYGDANVFHGRKIVVIRFYSTGGQLALGYKSDVGETHALQMLYERLYERVKMTVEKLSGEIL